MLYPESKISFNLWTGKISPRLNLVAWAFVALVGRAGDAVLHSQHPGGSLRSLGCTCWGLLQGHTCFPARSSLVEASAEAFAEVAAWSHFLLS